MKRAAAPMAVRLERGFVRVLEGAAALLVLAAVIMNVAQVFFRYVLGDSLTWTEEAMRYTAVWVAFLAGSVGLLSFEPQGAASSHPGIVRVARWATLALVAAFGAVLAWHGLPLAYSGLDQRSPAAEIPMALPYLAVGLGGVSIVIAAALRVASPPVTESDDLIRAEDVA